MPATSPAKKLSFSYYDEPPVRDQRREKQITFPYHPDEAMTTKIRQEVNVTIDGKKITIGTITATPTMTLIEGTSQPELGIGMDGIDLIANGESVPQTSGESSFLTHAFSMRYASLPENLQSVQLIIKKTGDTVQIPVK